MARHVPRLKAAAAVILIVLAFFFAPIIPYVQSVPVPSAQNNSVDVWGWTTPSYGVLGYGSAPYPSKELVTQGNHSALVFFEGAKAVAVENAGPLGVILNPSSTVAILSSAVSSSDWGFLNITMHMRNISYYNITNSVVYLSMEGFSANGTSGSLTYIEPRALGSCGATWASYDYCSVSQITPNNLPVNKTFTFYAEIRGTIKGVPFLYRQPFWEDYPRGGIGPQWVKAFIDNVNLARGGHLLTENSTLDAFAALRFKDASAGFQISDYNLSNDTASFFGKSAIAGQISELLLFPGIFSPNTYPSFLADYAVGHWDGLLNTNFSHFGYYVGEASYYSVSIPCPVYEIPGPGINITQFFQSHGCSTMIAATTWLVIIMGP